MSHPFTKKIGFEELGRFSPWVERLSGDLKPRQRTTSEIEREYDREKYAALTDFLLKNPKATPEDLRNFEMGDMKQDVCVSIGEELLLTSRAEAAKYYADQILDRLRPYANEADIICDIGGGWGYILWLVKKAFPGKRYWVGDYSQNGVKMGRQFMPDVQFDQIDLSSDYTIPFSKEEKVLCFSVYAYDNLPIVKPSMDRLAAMKGPAWTVCLFEPVFDWISTTDLGDLRRKYTIQNDYNRDLLSTLSDRSIIQKDPEYFGLNPLHPMSLITWR